MIELFLRNPSDFGNLILFRRCHRQHLKKRDEYLRDQL